MRLFTSMFFLIFTSFIIVGCTTFTTSDENYSNHKDLEELRPDQPVDTDLHEKLGYVHYTSEDINNLTNPIDFIRVNRTQIADMISRQLLHSADFEEVASLVTDQEIIIAYDHHTSLNSKEAKDIAKKTATSFVPEFYTVYTTSSPNHIKRIYQIHLSSARDQVNQEEIEKLIQEIKQTD